VTLRMRTSNGVTARLDN